MPSRILILISSLFFLIIILFLCWHFLLSIYEVKFKYNFTNQQLFIENYYQIECVGLNSLGWEIYFRDLECEYTIINGSELIKLNEKSENNIFSFSPLNTGEIIILANSKYSLNPTKYKLEIVKQ